MTKKSTPFLKFIIIYKGLFGVVMLALGISFFNFLDKDLAKELTRFAIRYNLDLDNRAVSLIIKQAHMVKSETMLFVAMTVLAVGVINVVESYGLHLKRRWAEWLTVFATGLLIPFELYHVILKTSFIKFAILVINILIVYYLAKHKELFKRKRDPE